ncbi:MAG TPA: Ig-like domain-containing protein, partial [Longimicrobiales bacterium]|nr:Ig-like domain-containing protein [Longimicrobiales bacterium]
MPRFSTLAGSAAATQPIHRIRLTAHDAATNAVVKRQVNDVSPDQAAWTVSFEIPIEGTTTQVVITIELINVTDGAESVEWSGQTTPVALNAAQSTTVREVVVHRGPVDNLTVTSVQIGAFTGPMVEGDSAQLSVSVATTGAAPTVFWTSLDENVATVGENGMVRALLPGTARISAVAGPHADTMTVAVAQRLVAIRIDGDDLSFESFGEQLTLSAVPMDPRNEPVATPVTWEIADPGVVEHVGNGVFEAKSNGTSVVTAVAANAPSISASVTLTVSQRVVTLAVSPAEARLSAIGATSLLAAAPRDANGHDVAGRAIAWASSDENVVEVAADGTITARAIGTAAVRALVADIVGGAGALAVEQVVGTAVVTVVQDVAVIAIEPVATTLHALGETVALRAVARDAGGTAIDDAAFIWSSANANVATVDANGVATATGNGEVVISATAHGVQANASLTVQQVVTRIDVTPTTLELTALAATGTLTAAAFDGGSSRVADAGFAWSTSDAAVASVDASGVVTAVGPGSVTIGASVDGVTGSASVRVDQVPANITIEPRSLTFDAFGDRIQAKAIVLDSNGNPIANTDIAWSSSDPAVASVAGTGLVTAHANGTAWVRASVNPTDSIPVTVEQAPASIKVAPDTVVLAMIGATHALTAEVFDPNGNPIADPVVTWTSTDVAVVTVAANGVATAVAAGTAAIVVTAGAVADTALVVVPIAIGATASGAVQLFEPPASVEPGAQESSTQIIAFREGERALDARGVLDITVPGAYTSSTPLSQAYLQGGYDVTSWFLHFDPIGSATAAVTGSITFDDPVVGIIVYGPNLVATDLLGAAETTYPTQASGRGLESPDVITLSADRRTVTLDLESGTTVDQVRILTRSVVEGLEETLPVTGALRIIGAPAAVTLDALDDDAFAVTFAESATVLGAAVPVDISDVGTYSTETALTARTLPAGMHIESHLIHFDPQATSSVTGSVTFHAPIVGVAVRGATLGATAVLGRAGTTYGADLAARGVGLAGSDAITVGSDGLTLTFTLTGSAGYDQIRVLTSHDAVPPPGVTAFWTGGTSTDWNDASNWGANAVPGASDIVWISAGTPTPTLTSDVTLAGLLVHSASIDIGSFTLSVTGNIDAGTTIISSTGTGSVRLTGSGTLQGVLPSVAVTGTYTVAGSTNVNGDLAVSGAGAVLSIAGELVEVTGDLIVTAGATFVMQHESGSVTVNGSAYFAGGDSRDDLTRGTLSVAGDFTQDAATSPFSFAPGGEHRVVLNGTVLQHVHFAAPANSSFFDLALENAAGYALAGAVRIDRNLDVLAPTTIGGSANGSAPLLTAGTITAVGANVLVLDGVPLMLEPGPGDFLGLDNAIFRNQDPNGAQLTVRGGGGTHTFTSLVFQTAPTSGVYVHAVDTDAEDDGDDLTIVLPASTPVNGQPFTTTAGDAHVLWSPGVATGALVLPDAATVSIGSTLQLEATLADPIGVPVAGDSFTWSSSNPAVATVDAAGLVTGIAEGSVTIAATASGAGYTATAEIQVLVPIPPAVTLVWDGTASTGFAAAANWLLPDGSPAGRAPNSTDIVFIRALPANQPALTGNGTVAGVFVQAGATMDLAGFTLTSSGNVVVHGDVANGLVILSGAGRTVRGMLPDVRVRASVLLDGPATMNSLVVEANRLLTLDGNSLHISGDMTLLANSAGGTFGVRMNDPADILAVDGLATFDTDGMSLTAGTMVLNGNIVQGPVRAGGLPAAGTAVVLSGTLPQTVTFHHPATSQSYFGDVTIANSAGVTFASNAVVTGQLTLAPGAVLTQAAGLWTRYTTALPRSAAGTYDVPETRVHGSFTMTEHLDLSLATNNLIVEANRLLTLGGHTLRVAGNVSLHSNSTGGTLGVRLNHAADVLIVEGTAAFDTDGMALTAGTIRFRGDFVQGPVRAGGLPALGTHVIFDGAAAQSVTFNHPAVSQSYFGDVTIANTTGVTFATNTVVRGQLDMAPGAVLTQAPAFWIRYTAALPRVAGGTYDVVNTRVHDAITMAEDLDLDAPTNDLLIESNQLLTLAGHSLRVGGDLTTNPNSTSGTFGVRLNDPADLLTVAGAATFDTDGMSLTDGTMVLKGNVVQGTVRAGGLPALGTHVILDGAAPQTVTFHHPATTQSYFGDVTISNEAGVTFASTVVVRGQLVLGTNAVLMQSSAFLTRYTTALPRIAAGTYDVVNTRVHQSFTMAENLDLPLATNHVVIESNQLLTLAGHTLSIGGSLTTAPNSTSGTFGVRLNDPADVLVVAGPATFDTDGMALTAGTMILQGDVVQGSVRAGGLPAAGTHVILSGTAPQTVTFHHPATTQSYFGDVTIANNTGVTFTTGVVVKGQLILDPGAVLNQSDPQWIRYTTALPRMAAGTYNVTNTRVHAPITMTEDVDFGSPANHLIVDANQLLTLAGHQLRVGGNLTLPPNSTSGTHGVRLNDPADVLTVVGGATFDTDGMSLSAGSIVFMGDVTQGPTRAGGLPASGTSVTFAGAAPQTVTFHHPTATQSYLSDVTIAAGANVTFSTNVLVKGSLDHRGTLSVATARTLTVQGTLISRLASSLANLGAVSAAVCRLEGGTLTGNALACTTTDAGTGATAVWLGNSADWQTAANWSPASVPETDDIVWIPASVGMMPALSANATVQSIIVDGGAALDLSGFVLTVTDDVRAGTIADATGTGRLQMTGTAELDGSVPALRVTGHVTLVGATSATAAVIGSSGSLTIGPHALTIAGNLTVESTAELIMTDPASSVDVNGNVTIGGTSTSGDLTAGVLRIGGDFTQPSSSWSAAAFAATGTHTTVFDGSALQTVNFTHAASSQSHFRNVEITNAAGVHFATNALAEGNLGVTGGVLTDVGTTALIVGGAVTSDATSTFTLHRLYIGGAQAIANPAGYDVAVTRFTGTAQPMQADLPYRAVEVHGTVLASGA